MRFLATMSCAETGEKREQMVEALSPERAMATFLRREHVVLAFLGEHPWRIVLSDYDERWGRRV
jgi:hypothetical protein